MTEKEQVEAVVVLPGCGGILNIIDVYFLAIV
jgi:hypothetical protein